MGVRLADQIERGLDDLRDQILRLARAGRTGAHRHRSRLAAAARRSAGRQSSTAGLTETKWARCAIVKEGAADHGPAAAVDLERDGHGRLGPGHTRVPGGPGLRSWRHQPAGKRGAGADRRTHRRLRGGRSSSIWNGRGFDCVFAPRRRRADGGFAARCRRRRTARSRTGRERSMPTGGPAFWCRMIRWPASRRCSCSRIRRGRWSPAGKRK